MSVALPPLMQQQLAGSFFLSSFLVATMLSQPLGCVAPSASSSPKNLSPFEEDAGFAVDFPADDATLSATYGPRTDDATVLPAVAPDPALDVAAASEDGSEDPPFDAAPEGACPSPLAPGDLIIDELMIASVAGAGDYGEWLEVLNTRSCAVDLQGLHGECPRGASVVTFDVADPRWIPPQGTFVVADSVDPALNHRLPGFVIEWAGRRGDILRNKGTTLTLSLDTVLIDSVTYPALSQTVGESIAFPSDCDPTGRSDWTRWQTSTASWFPAFFGTPNAPNDDVHCPQP